MLRVVINKQMCGNYKENDCFSSPTIAVKRYEKVFYTIIKYKNSNYQTDNYIFKNPPLGVNNFNIFCFLKKCFYFCHLLPQGWTTCNQIPGKFSY